MASSDSEIRYVRINKGVRPYGGHVFEVNEQFTDATHVTVNITPRAQRGGGDGGSLRVYKRDEVQFIIKGHLTNLR